ncbi:maleylpyruvate isomerase family mycothiol-dependent enzyme [Cellulomonas cellasea]|uniref:Mycothiol-dependent maleylpyruvate isomerase metal-binding domain-containing protein n=2 Tax=Cellulomonas cellasea TaxID=43670 RepID=A0A0A0B995_9CELL|nr:maleylpyruvate isomerase family mycothiol-dependent enzyme [Cellulomonas cellasea]KGM02374.1 hypothetical protein Q760_13910 [Cellulomonas cellasea DSM 20118]GEA89293.1 hypothetical protein CCE01nite_32420 [Cellulomonas cellasea]
MTDADLDHLALLGLAQRDFLAAIDLVPADAPVPACGAWTVADLVDHLAEIHRWAAAMARGEDEVPLERGRAPLAEHYSRCAQELAATLRDLGPDAPCETLEGAGRASFWRRRQLHETLVHLWDLRTAAGLPVDAAPEVWADTVDEVVHVMQPRQVRLGRMPALDVALDLTALDAGRTWRLGTGRDAPHAAVAGSAASLALLLWGRRTPGGPHLAVAGDAAALDRALAQALVP